MKDNNAGKELFDLKTVAILILFLVLIAIIGKYATDVQTLTTPTVYENQN